MMHKATQSNAAQRANTAKRPAREGQASIEILVYVGFFLFLFVVLNLFFVVQMGADISARQYTLSQETAGQLSDDIRLALLAGPGFNATFQMPPTIGSQPYTARFYNSSLYVESDAPVLAGAGTASSYGNRFYYPIGTSVILACTYGGAGCYGRNVTFDISGNGNLIRCDYQVSLSPCMLLYNFTQSGGRIRIQNVLDAKGYPQLQVISVS